MQTLRGRRPEELALRTVAAGGDARALLRRLGPDRWTDLLTSAETHGLMPLLASEVDPDAELPPAIAARLGEWVRRAAIADLRAEAELNQIATAFDTHGVSWLTYKGPALAAHTYATKGVRTYADLDLLVHVDSLGEAFDCLIALGAVPRERNYTVMAAQGRAEMSLDMPGGTEVDLHWHPVLSARTRQQLRWPAQELLARRRQVRLAPSGLATFIPDPTDHLLMVATHLTLAGGVKLIWCRDVLESIHHDPPDWDALVERARRWRIALPVAVALQRAAGTVSAPVPSEVTDALGGGMWWRATAVLDAVAPAGLSPGRRLTGRLPFAATRGTSAASLRALVRDGLAERRHPAPGATAEQLRLARGRPADWFASARLSESRAL